VVRATRDDDAHVDTTTHGEDEGAQQGFIRYEVRRGDPQPPLRVEGAREQGIVDAVALDVGSASDDLNHAPLFTRAAPAAAAP
jgi:hypothetical protein